MFGKYLREDTAAAARAEDAARDAAGRETTDALRGAWNLLRLVATGSLVVAGAFMSSCGGLLLGARAASIPRGPDARDVSGKVVRLLVEESHSRGRRLPNIYRPVVQFEADGRTHEFNGRLGVSGEPPAWTVGQTVNVRYDTRRPDRGEMMGWQMWKPGVTWTGTGLALLAAGIPLWRRRWWTRPGFW
jgi:hypothetical protein